MISYVIPYKTGIIIRHDDAVPIEVWSGRNTFIAEFDEIETAQAICVDLNRTLIDQKLFTSTAASRKIPIDGRRAHSAGNTAEPASGLQAEPSRSLA